MKQYLKRALLVIIPFSFLAFVLYLLFRNSYRSIIDQLGKTSAGLFFVMVLIGLVYELVDAALTYRLIHSRVPHITYWEAVQLIFLGVFMNIATYGTGIKPAQTLCLGRKGVDYGQAFSMMTMPYIYHKSMIVIYALCMIVLQRSFVMGYFGDYLHYMIAGGALSIVILVALVLVCASKRVSNLFCHILDRVIRKEKWQEKKENIKNSLHYLYQETNELIRSKKTWCFMLTGNFFKMSLWYMIPFFAILSVGESLNGVSFIMIITTTAIMQLIIGVIPTAGGMVSTEVIYILLFSFLLSSETAGATMLLYRTVTYYIPFLVSIPIVLSIRFLRGGHPNDIS